MDNYYEYLKEELENFDGSFPKFILNIPDFFKLLCELMDEDLDKETKKRINCALAYFVLPNDVISEDIYGPLGYVDDIYVCTIVLKEILEKQGVDMLERHWEGDEEISKVLEDCYNASLNELKKKDLVSEVLAASALD